MRAWLLSEGWRDGGADERWHLWIGANGRQLLSIPMSGVTQSFILEAAHTFGVTSETVYYAIMNASLSDLTYRFFVHSVSLVRAVVLRGVDTKWNLCDERGVVLVQFNVVEELTDPHWDPDHYYPLTSSFYKSTRGRWVMEIKP